MTRLANVPCILDLNRLAQPIMSLKLSNHSTGLCPYQVTSYLTYKPIILRDRVYCCIICPDLPHPAQCPIIPLLIRKQNAMILITPKPPTSASCFLKMLLLPFSYSCPTLALSQRLKSFRLYLFVTVWGECLDAGSHQLWNPLAGEEGSLPSWNAGSRGHIASVVVLSSRAGNCI